MRRLRKSLAYVLTDMMYMHESPTHGANMALINAKAPLSLNGCMGIVHGEWLETLTWMTGEDGSIAEIDTIERGYAGCCQEKCRHTMARNE